MSQRILKRDLTIMDSVASLSDQELRAALKDFEVSPGPITDSTRSLYRKKLATLMEERDKGRATNLDANLSDDDDTSDEDFEVRDEDLEEEEDLDDEESEDDDELAEEEEEDLLSELQDDDLSSSRIYADQTSRSRPGTSTSRASRTVFISALSFSVLALGFYLISTNKLELLEPLRPYKDISRRILILFTFSPLVYALYKIFTFYRLRRHEDSQKVCKLVSEALELLQSPENPKGLMPVLHIRDTLLTPAERKAKKANLLWQKAVKFIEEHESRVKVEMVNIDGEDFRAWKWIGRKL